MRSCHWVLLTVFLVITFAFSIIAFDASAAGPVVPHPDYPLIDIEVQQSEGQVHFRFYWRDEKGKPPKRLPVDAWNIAVYMPGGTPTIWEIISPRNGQRTTQATYGLVPQGFQQTVPTEGAAPPLEVNRQYYVGVSGEGGIGSASFTYTGP